MGKHEKGTPKELANRVKSRGLQKLKWFCQMCQKQCRDSNGFKCHLTSEAHQRQLLLFAENSNAYLKQFSSDFEKNFLLLLRTSYGTKRVRANEVYNMYIKDKGHVHMNATVWHSLTGFVQYLGKTEKCKIDEGDKGWYIQYIDKEALVRKQEEERKLKQEKDDEERHMKIMENMVQKGLLADDGTEHKPTELVRTDDKITLDLSLNKKPAAEELARPTTSGSIFDKAVSKKVIKKEEPPSDDEADVQSSSVSDKKRSRSPDKRGEAKKSRKTALDEIREMEERKKEKKNRKDYWMHEGIIVKIITKSLGHDYYKAKGVVKKLVDEYTAQVRLDDGTLVKLDQEHVETVIPSIGRKMLVVNGAYRGCEAELEELDEKHFSLRLKITSGLMKGRTITVPYEDASKLA